MASAHPGSLSTQPLLRDFDNGIDTQHEDRAPVSLRSLEDGEGSGPEFGGLNQRPGLWQRLRMEMRRRRIGEVKAGNGRRLREGEEEEARAKRYRYTKRTCLIIPVVLLSIFGIIHLTNFFLGSSSLLWSDPSLDWPYPGWDIGSAFLDITHNVTPIPCHSHNDYWRRVPLYDALHWGCTGVEADVWLFDDSELYVGHSTWSLTSSRTFRSLYVDPLVAMLEHKNRGAKLPTSDENGVFDTAPAQTLVLLVDFKTDGHALFPIVSQQLSALREKGYLSYFNGSSTIFGPITVVATGNAPFDLVTTNHNATYRDIFFDAPLAQMYSSEKSHSSTSMQSSTPVQTTGQGNVGTSPDSTFSVANSYYASANFQNAIGWLWWGDFSAHQLDLLRGQIRGAHERGLKARYWGAPTWPEAHRNRVWDVLVSEGVDYLNDDDLEGMSRVDYGRRNGVEGGRGG